MAALLNPDNEMVEVRSAEVRAITDTYREIDKFVARMLKKTGLVRAVVPVVDASENWILAGEIERRIVAVWKESVRSAAQPGSL